MKRIKLRDLERVTCWHFSELNSIEWFKENYPKGLGINQIIPAVKEWTLKFGYYCWSTNFVVPFSKLLSPESRRALCDEARHNKFTMFRHLSFSDIENCVGRPLVDEAGHELLLKYLRKDLENDSIT